MTHTREQVINLILKHLNIRLSLDKLYENYTNGKYHKKIVKYNKDRDVPHYRNPYSLYFGDELLPSFIKEELKKCVMCNEVLKEDETSVYCCVKCYNKYPFYTIVEKKKEKNENM